MDLKKVERLIQLVQRYRLDELELDSGSEKVRIRANGGHGATHHSRHVGAAVPNDDHDIGSGHADGGPGGLGHGGAASSGTEAVRKENQTVIRSPFVGTFYAAPAPDAPPFVKIGQRVQKGDALCIVEAMKLMNEIEAEVSGTVVEILVANGTPIEFEQPLFVIET